MRAKIEATVGRRAREIEPLAIYQLMTPSVEMARKNLIRLVPLLLPKSAFGLKESAMYRFVLDHGDFGIHNMTVAMDAQGQPRITSVYDWEGGRIVPAILCEPKMVTTVDLAIDEKGKPNISRWGDGDTPDKMAQYRRWAEEYYKVLFSAAPELKRIIKAGREARRLWFALCDGHNQDADEHFRQLGIWAGKKVTQLEGREETKRKLANMLCAPSKPVYDHPAKSTVI